MNGNREIEVSERWGCGCIGTFDSGLTWAQSWNQIQTLKDFLSCHIYCAQLGSPQLGPKCKITNSLSGQISWDTNRTTRIQLQNSLHKTTHVITRNRNIIPSRLVFIRIHFHAVSSRLLLGPCHSNVSPSWLQSPTISYGDCRVHKHPVVQMRRIILAIVLVWINRNCWRKVHLLR